MQKKSRDASCFFGNSNRKKAEEYKLVLPLCPEHHRNGVDSPHRNRMVDIAYKCWGQFAYEQYIGTREDFYHDFGRYYI